MYSHPSCGEKWETGERVSSTSNLWWCKATVTRVNVVFCKAALTCFCSNRMGQMTNRQEEISRAVWIENNLCFLKEENPQFLYVSKQCASLKSILKLCDYWGWECWGVGKVGLENGRGMWKTPGWDVLILCAAGLTLPYNDTRHPLYQTKHWQFPPPNRLQVLLTRTPNWPCRKQTKQFTCD